MKDLAIKLLSLSVPAGHIAVCMTGQAGVVVKTPSGELAGIDLFLSDCSRRYAGFKRLIPSPLSPDELEFDYVIATHAHCDHYDPDSIPLLLQPEKTRFIGALDCKEECRKQHIPEEKCTFLETHDTIQAGSMKITATTCDHSKDTPHAIGLCIECEGKRLVMAGDTCFREDIAEELGAHQPDIMFAPINGMFGNLSEAEAARFFSIAKPKLAVPCHFWCCAEHRGDPAKFMDEMKKYPDQPYKILALGEIIII